MDILPVLEKFFDRFGLPIALLLAIAYASMKFAKWAAPLFTGLIQSHIETISSVTVNSATTAETLRQLLVISQQHIDAQRRTRRMIVALAGMIGDVAEKQGIDVRSRLVRIATLGDADALANPHDPV